MAEHVVVTVPQFRCRDHLRPCVDGILAQTHADLTAIVVNDGDDDVPWDVLEDITDPRLVRFDLPRNRGRYFADQVVLTASRAPYLLVHDADDWSEPQRIERLLRELRRRHAAAAFSAAWRPGLGGTAGRVVDPDRIHLPLGPSLQHRAWHHGLYRTDALRAVGGFHAGMRVAFDTYLVNAMAMTMPIATVPEPLYHLRPRADSLTRAAATGHGSALRRRTHGILQTMYREAFAAYAAYLDGDLDRDELLGRVRAVTEARVTPEERAAVAIEADRLAALLGRPGERRPAAARPALRGSTPDRP